MRRQFLLKSCLGLLATVWSFASLAQSSISGKVSDPQGGAIQYVTVAIQGTNKGAITDDKGSYTIKNVANGSVVLVASFVGYASEKKTLSVSGETTADFTLREDALELESVVVTGTFDPRTKLQSSVAITTLNARNIEQRAARGTGDLLQAIPGTFVDNSAGEIDNKILPRGLVSGSLGQGTGFRYVSLQEDGLPVSATLLGYSPPDVMFRADVMSSRLEAVRGGSASIAAANAPGGVYNFISTEGGSTFTGSAKLQGGINGAGLLSRADVQFGGPIANSGWTYSIGGFYRYDEGARNINFPANVGGQLKFNLVKNTAKGKIKFYGKYLNDRNLVFRNIPVTDLADPKGFGKFDLNYSAAIGDLRGNLYDGEFYRTDKTATRDWDSRNAVLAKSWSLGLDIIREIGNGFTLENNIKYAYQNSRYNQITAEQLIPIQALNGLGGVIMSDVKTGAELYNSTTGANSIGSFLQLVAPLDMRNQMNNFIDLLSINKKTGKHSITFGAYFSIADIKLRWDADLAAQAFEPNPRALRITTNNPFKAATGNTPDRLDYTDSNGFYSYGTVAYTNFNDKVNTFALFATDSWQLSERLNLDLGIRYESLNHTGGKEAWAPPALGTLALPASLATINQIGADGKYGTRYETGMRIGSGKFFNFDFTHSYVSGSVGLNYQLSDRTALYGRFTKGTKAPDADYYVSNFVNTNYQKGVDEDITMGELGYKVNSKTLALSTTLFYSQLSNIPYTILINNTVTGESFYTPPTFNSTRTIGLEIEANIRGGKHFNLGIIGTIQDASYTKFDFYNTNGFQHNVFIGSTYPDKDPTTGVPYVNPDNRLTPSFPQVTPGANIAAGTPSFHTIESLDGKKVDNLPSVVFDVTPTFLFGKFSIYTNWRYTGERYYNKQNALSMPSFSVFNAGLTYNITNNVEFAARVSNLFNSAALIQNDGLGRPGAAGVDAIKIQDIAAQKAAGYPFWGRPLLPRSVMLSLSYRF